VILGQIRMIEITLCIVCTHAHRLDHLFRPPASGFSAMQAPSAAGSGIDDFSDITNAVAAAAISSTSETSFSFTIQDPTAAIVLLNHLRTKGSVCKSAYYAGLYAVDEANKPQFRGIEISSVSDQLNALAGIRIGALSAIMTAGEGNTTALRNAAGCAPLPSGTAALSIGGTPLYSFAAQDPCVTAFNNLDGSYNAFLQGLSRARVVGALCQLMQKHVILPQRKCQKCGWPPQLYLRVAQPISAEFARTVSGMTSVLRCSSQASAVRMEAPQWQRAVTAPPITGYSGQKCFVSASCSAAMRRAWSMSGV
jgi:hypothetical protein